jgi:hypothetical protein
VTVIEAYRLARTQKVRKPRESMTLRLARFAATKLPRWSDVRTGVLQVTGLGCIDYAAWTLHTSLGVLAVGISLFIIEALTGGE